MTIKRPLASSSAFRPLDAFPYFPHDAGAEGYVGNEVSVHDVNMQPVGVVGVDGVSAGFAEAAEVGGEDGGRDDCGGWLGGHFEYRKGLLFGGNFQMRGWSRYLSR